MTCGSLRSLRLCVRFLLGAAAALTLTAALKTSALRCAEPASGPQAPSANKPAEKPAPPANSAKTPETKPEPADNSYCYVCHLNYEEEELSSQHQKIGVGCEKCHGPSVKHSGDEDGLIPPDILYPRPEVMAFCYTCHPQAEILDQGEHTEFYEKLEKAKAAGKKPKEETCTDCHGKEHRLKVRTRIWDKKTRKLISDDGVRMMSK